MNDNDIRLYLPVKNSLDHNIRELQNEITVLQLKLKYLEKIKKCVNQVTDVVDGVLLNISRKVNGIEIRTITTETLKYKWGHVYRTVFPENDPMKYGVCINGKGGHWGGGENLYQGDKFVGFYATLEEAEKILLDWVVRGIEAKEF